VLTTSLLCFSKFYSSFLREHKILRYYSNPGGVINGVIKYCKGFIKKDSFVFRKLGKDARIIKKDNTRKLVIFVVGESARADHFSLNGYSKETNPLLKNSNVTTFTNFRSSFTSTAKSVPSMFSIYPTNKYDREKILNTENSLDILKKCGVNVLWLDNNSDSKGVALRVNYQRYKSHDINPVCDIECRDVGMLANLQTYIKAHPTGDFFIVLHQMGSHGPSYYKRYPKEFEIFKPVVKSNHFENCSKEQINNAYDNTILYTDYFLAKTIDFLKGNDSKFKTLMFYVSDHGESLGENGIYLHGLPNFIAPDTQRHIAAVLWHGKQFKNIRSFKVKCNDKLSHDNLFDTILGIMDVKTTVYNSENDFLTEVK
jgi:lipid A ethanolaminephosphotransferase